jgi:HEAT repeat protein
MHQRCALRFSLGTTSRVIGWNLRRRFKEADARLKRVGHLLQNRELTSELIELMADPNWTVRIAAITDVSRLDQHQKLPEPFRTEAIAATIGALEEDRRPGVSLAAARALVRYGDAAVAPTIEAASQRFRGGRVRRAFQRHAASLRDSA